MHDAVVRMEQVRFAYQRGAPLFESLDFSLSPGCVAGLLGKNGAGKTTLLKLALGALFPDRGTAEVRGIPAELRRPEALERVVFVPEQIEVTGVTVERYLEFHHGYYREFDLARAREYLRRFEVDPAGFLPRLSFGRQKKVLLAAALAAGTDLLVFDEPTNGLDIPTKQVFRELIREAAREGRSVLISTHQIKDVEDVLDRVVILDEGRVVFESSAAEAIRAVESLRAGDTRPAGEIDLELLFNVSITDPAALHAVCAETARERDDSGNGAGPGAGPEAGEAPEAEGPPEAGERLEAGAGPEAEGLPEAGERLEAGAEPEAEGPPEAEVLLEVGPQPEAEAPREAECPPEAENPPEVRPQPEAEAPREASFPARHHAGRFDTSRSTDTPRSIRAPRRAHGSGRTHQTRFVHVLRHEARNHGRSMATIVSAVVGTMMLVQMLQWVQTPTAINVWNGFGLVLLITGIIVTSGMFNELRSPSLAVELLLRPAGVGEKVGAKLLVSTVLFGLIVTAAYLVASATALSLYLMIGGRGNLLVFLDDGAWGHTAFGAFLRFLPVQAAFFFGSVYFRKNPVGRTLLSVVAWIGSYIVLGLFMVRIAFSPYLTGRYSRVSVPRVSGFALNEADPALFGNRIWIEVVPPLLQDGDVLRIVFQVLVTLAFWSLAFVRFRETER